MGATAQINTPIIFFDGVCNLCEASVQFVIKRDKSNTFRFASLQSASAAKLLTQTKLEASDLESAVLLQDGVAYVRSTAALKIAQKLNGLWPILSIFLIVPRFVRDPFYNFIAKNRYRWFGKKEQCMVPAPELRSRFLE